MKVAMVKVKLDVNPRNGRWELGGMEVRTEERTPL